MSISLTALKELLEKFFEQKNIKTKIWFYEAILVADILEDNYKYGFDFYILNNQLHIDLIARNQITQQYLSYTLDNLKSQNKVRLTSFNLDQYNEQYIVDYVQQQLNHFMVKISVIVPVYNREKLIVECLSSLIRQTLDKHYFEVILVDDCSVDQSVNVIKQFITKNDLKHFRLFERNYNSGGAGLPRNDGIMIARGKYIFFLDSDDFIADNALENMLVFAEEYKSDILYIKYASAERRMPVKPFRSTVGKASLSKNNLFLSLGPNKMFRREFLKNNKIYFPLGIKRGEDAMFMVTALSLAANKSVLADQEYYHVTLHDEGHLYDRREINEEIHVAAHCISLIFSSNLDLSEKNNFLSVFLKRILTTVVNIFRYSRYGWSDQQKEEWFNFVVKFYKLYLTEYNEHYLNQELRQVLQYIKTNDLLSLKQFYGIVNNIKGFEARLVNGKFLVEGSNISFDVSFMFNFNYAIDKIEKINESSIRLIFNYEYTPFQLESEKFSLSFINAIEGTLDFFTSECSIDSQANSGRVIFIICSKDFKKFASNKWHIIFGLALDDRNNIKFFEKKLRYYHGFENIRLEELEFYVTKNSYIAVRK